jgi:hypothetical protein
MSRSNNPYKLEGLRAILSVAPAAAAIQYQLEALELAIEQGSAQAFDMADGLLGSICKTVMADRNHPCDGSWHTVKLFKETVGKLPLVPNGHPDPAKARDNLEETLRGLTATVQGLYNLRLNHGVIAHGRDAYAVTLQAAQIELAARAADALGCFLLSIHRNYTHVPTSDRIRYEDNVEFNDWLDEEYPVSVWDVELDASKALFHCDREAYKEALAEFTNSPDESDAAEGGGTP